MTIRVFVGTAPNHEDAESQAVLEYSLRKHASRPVEITWMKLSHEGPFSGWDTSRWATPFTPFRWAVPELAGFHGRALYVDSDVIFMRDVVELYHQQFRGDAVAMNRGGSRWCVTLFECDGCHEWFPPLEEMRADPSIHNRMRGYFAKNPRLQQAFHGHWNCLDGEEFEDVRDPRIGLIHYSSMRYQPSHEYAVPRLAAEGRKHWFDGEIRPHWREDLRELFAELLTAAEEAGYTVESYCQDPLYGDYTKRAVGSHGRPHWAGRLAPSS